MNLITVVEMWNLENDIYIILLYNTPIRIYSYRYTIHPIQTIFNSDGIFSDLVSYTKFMFVKTLKQCSKKICRQCFAIHKVYAYNYTTIII